MRKPLSYYEDLPEALEVFDFESELSDLLDESCAETLPDILSELEAIIELSGRILYKFDDLKKESRDRLEDRVMSYWNINSIEIVDLILSIIPEMKMSRAFESIEEQNIFNENLESKRIISEAFAEYGSEFKR